MNPHEELSAWMDGQAQPDRAEAMVKTVLEDPQSRARWNEWHLIGDVMRSAALARPTSVANGVAQALAKEPVHLPVAASPQAPSAPTTSTPIRRRMPRAMAGGAIAAALAFVVLVSLAPQMQQADGPGQQLAEGGRAPQALAVGPNQDEVFRAASSAPPLKYQPESLKGFKVVGVYERHGQSGIEMRRYVLSDGSSAVSVQVQPRSAVGPAEAAQRAGAVSMLSRDIEDLRFVVSGDVPPDALRQFIQTIEWKKTP